MPLKKSTYPRYTSTIFACPCTFTCSMLFPPGHRATGHPSDRRHTGLTARAHRLLANARAAGGSKCTPNRFAGSDLSTKDPIRFGIELVSCAARPRPSRRSRRWSCEASRLVVPKREGVLIPEGVGRGVIGPHVACAAAASSLQPGKLICDLAPD